MNGDRSFVLINPGASETATARSNFSIAGSALSSLAITPIGLSVLALSLAAAVRFKQWRGFPAHRSDETASVPSTSRSAHNRDATSDDAPRESAEVSGSQTTGDRKKRTKPRRKRGKDSTKELVHKNGRSTKGSSRPKLDVSLYHQQSYASPSTYGPFVMSSNDGELRAYAASAGSGSVAPSVLGDDPSSSSVSDMGEQGVSFNGLRSRRRDEDEDDAYATTPVAPSRARRVPRPAPALASLRLPPTPLRPSKLTIRTLNAFADLPVSQSSSADSPKLSPSRTITSADTFTNGRPQYTSHSPAPSNATSSTTTNVISVFSATSSSASSQLSPTTPPATLTTTNSHTPVRALNSASPDGDDDGSSECLHNSQTPEANSTGATADWIGGIETPSSGPPCTSPRAQTQLGHGHVYGPRLASHREDDLAPSLPMTEMEGSGGATRPSASGQAYHIGTGISVPEAANDTMWDDSLDWHSPSNAPGDGEHHQGEEVEVVKSYVEPSSSGSPVRHVFPDPQPSSSSWGAPELPTSVSLTTERFGERTRSSSNAAAPGSYVRSASMSASIGVSTDSTGTHDVVEDEAEQPPAALDILFPSLDDPPPSPHAHQQHDYSNGADYSAPELMDSVGGGEDASSLETALDAAKMREERWRAECARLVAECERLRWAWNRRETEMQNQMFQFMSVYGGTQTQSASQSQVSSPQRQQQSLGNGRPGGKQSQQTHQSMTSTPMHAPTPGQPVPYGLPMPVSMNMHPAMMNPNAAGAALTNGMVPMMAFPIPVHAPLMQSPGGSAVPPGNNLNSPGSHSQPATPSSRRGSYPRGNRTSRSRSRAPSPFNSNTSGDAGRTAPSPKRQTSTGPPLTVLSPMSSTPPTPLRALPPRSTSSSGGSGFRYPISNSTAEQESVDAALKSPYEDLPSSSVLEVEEECNEEGEDEDGIPDGLASAILKNPLRGNSSRSSPRASNVPPTTVGGIGALQQLPAPIPPLTRTYLSSPTMSSGAAGLANLIMRQPPVLEDDDKTPEVEKTHDKSLEERMSPMPSS